MVSDDSPLRRLPVTLPRRQVMFTDALRLSAEMASFSFRNLEDLLKALVDGQRPEGFAAEAIAHAFSVIDAANRFRAVIRKYPGLKQNTPAFQLFIRKTAAVESLRNILQHLDGELQSIGEQQLAALGTITWLGPSANEESPPGSWTLQPGSFYRGQLTFGPEMDLGARILPDEIRQIHLVTSGTRVDLSDTVERIKAAT